jgi:hypothetical protein
VYLVKYLWKGVSKSITYATAYNCHTRFGCECGWRDGKVETAKYKMAKTVKAGLMQMGYKQ